MILHRNMFNRNNPSSSDYVPDAKSLNPIPSLLHPYSHRYHETHHRHRRAPRPQRNHPEKSGVRDLISSVCPKMLKLWPKMTWKPRNMSNFGISIKYNPLLQRLFMKIYSPRGTKTPILDWIIPLRCWGNHLRSRQMTCPDHTRYGPCTLIRMR